jgi:simple sugar transport system permease protein
VEELIGSLGPLLASTIRNATPLAFAALGGLFSERAGVVNIGLEGLMLIAAFAGVAGATTSGSTMVGLGVALLAGAAFALVHAAATITFDADQIISGTAINLLALGGTGFLMVELYGAGGTSPRIDSVGPLAVPGLSSIPVLGQGLFDQSPFVYALYLLVPLTWYVLYRTSFGLRLRAVGEVPEAVDAAGVSVTRLRYAGVVLSGLLAAGGGAFLSMSLLSAFTENMTVGRGFIALAALIFGRWNPLGAAAAAVLFGFAQALVNTGIGATVPPQLVESVPYLLTLVALAGVGGRAVAPAASGRPYRKE